MSWRTGRFRERRAGKAHQDEQPLQDGLLTGAVAAPARKTFADLQGENQRGPLVGSKIGQLKLEALGPGVVRDGR